MRIKFPKGAVGHRDGGGMLIMGIGKNQEIYQRADVYFEPGFSFKLSGKIIGLGNDNGKWSGGSTPSNGEGFSSRFHWQDGQTAGMYLYHMDQENQYGEGISLGFEFKSGITYTLTQRIKKNTGSDKNGILQVWVSKNGGPHELLLTRTNMRWGTNGR